MLFNSYEFILAFLPVTLVLFYWIGAGGRTQLALGWLVAASLFFYAWWNPIYLGLLMASLVVNFGLGRLLTPAATGQRRRRRLLGVGIALNLGLLGWFKYANFFVATVNQTAGTG